MIAVWRVRGDLRRVWFRLEYSRRSGALEAPPAGGGPLPDGPMSDPCSEGSDLAGRPLPEV